MINLFFTGGCSKGTGGWEWVRCPVIIISMALLCNRVWLCKTWPWIVGFYPIRAKHSSTIHFSVSYTVWRCLIPSHAACFVSMSVFLKCGWTGQVTHYKGVHCTQSLTPIPYSVLWIYMGQWNFDSRFCSHQTQINFHDIKIWGSTSIDHKWDLA